jgi:hypothetical protein
MFFFSLSLGEMIQKAEKKKKKNNRCWVSSRTSKQKRSLDSAAAS